MHALHHRQRSPRADRLDTVGLAVEPPDMQAWAYAEPHHSPAIKVTSHQFNLSAAMSLVKEFRRSFDAQ